MICRAVHDAVRAATVRGGARQARPDKVDHILAINDMGFSGHAYEADLGNLGHTTARSRVRWDLPLRRGDGPAGCQQGDAAGNP